MAQYGLCELASVRFLAESPFLLHCLLHLNGLLAHKKCKCRDVPQIENAGGTEQAAGLPYLSGARGCSWSSALSFASFLCLATEGIQETSLSSLVRKFSMTMHSWCHCMEIIFAGLCWGLTCSADSWLCFCASAVSTGASIIPSEAFSLACCNSSMCMRSWVFSDALVSIPTSASGLFGSAALFIGLLLAVLAWLSCPCLANKGREHLSSAGTPFALGNTGSSGILALWRLHRWIDCCR